MKYGTTRKCHSSRSVNSANSRGGWHGERLSGRRFRWVDHLNPNVFGHPRTYRTALDRITRDGEVSSIGRAFIADNGDVDQVVRLMSNLATRQPSRESFISKIDARHFASFSRFSHPRRS